MKTAGINKTDGGKGRAKRQLHKVERRRARRMRYSQGAEEAAMDFDESKKKFIAYARKRGWTWIRAISDRRAHGRRWKLHCIYHDGAGSAHGNQVRNCFKRCFPGRAFTVLARYKGWAWSWVAYESKQSALQSRGTPMLGV